MKIEPLASCTKVPLVQQPRRLRLHNYSTRPLIPQARQAIFEKSMRLLGMSEIQGTIYPHLVLPLNYGSVSQRYNGLGLQKKILTIYSCCKILLPLFQRVLKKIHHIFLLY